MKKGERIQQGPIVQLSPGRPTQQSGRYDHLAVKEEKWNLNMKSGIIFRWNLSFEEWLDGDEAWKTF